MSTPVRQQSFAGGELSPDLWARTEYDRYLAGGRRLRNMIVTPLGSALNRAGTQYVSETRLSGRGRLIPFTFSPTDTLLLAFTDLRIRFYTWDPVAKAAGPVVYPAGAPVWVPGTVYGPGACATYGGQMYVTDGGSEADRAPAAWPDIWRAVTPGDPYEVATTYAAAQLPKLRYAQVGDVITICHPDHTPRELTRVGAGGATAVPSFTLADVSFDVPPFPVGVAAYVQYPLPAEELPTYPARQWIIKVSAICQDLKGNVFETTPIAITEQRAQTWSDRKNYAQGEYVFHAGKNWRATNYDPIVGEEPGALTRDTDSDGISDTSAWVDMGAPPPLPEKIPIYPSKQITIFTERTAPLPTPTRSSRIIAYRVYRGRGKLFGYTGEIDEVTLTFVDSGDTPDWTRTPPKGENPFKIYDALGALIRTENPAVVAHHEQRRVFARTNERPGFIFFSGQNAYSIFDQHDPALAEDAITMELASWRWEEIRALISGRVLLAHSSAGEWAVDGGADGAPMSAAGGFAARPRTERGTSWVEPLKVGDDDVLFIPSTGNRVRQLAYDGNKGTYDAPDISMFAEHLFRGREIVGWDWQELPWSQVWAVFSDGGFAALAFLGREVVAWCSQETQGLVEDICCVREGGEDVAYWIVARTVGGQTKRYIERMASRQVTDAKEGVFLDSALTYRGAPVTHLSGLDHLEGCTVNALADGNVVKGLVVQDGAVDLPGDLFPDGASVVHVGLPYVSEMETLDLPPGQGRNRVKTIDSITVEYRASRGMKVAGASDEPGRAPKWQEWRQRKRSHGFDPIPLEDGLVNIPVDSEWNKGGRVLVRQEEPLPLAVLAVSREVTYGA